MRAVMTAIIEAIPKTHKGVLATGEAYEAYKSLCQRIGLRVLSTRVFWDLIAELDVYSLIRSRLISRGRYGRTREILLELPKVTVDRIYLTLMDGFHQ